jgi:hypothetical protein
LKYQTKCDQEAFVNTALETLAKLSSSVYGLAKRIALSSYQSRPIGIFEIIDDLMGRPIVEMSNQVGVSLLILLLTVN